METKNFYSEFWTELELEKLNNAQLPTMVIVAQEV